ncbi:MAG: aldehyde dehydrogenase family protein, partial [Nitrospiraceae bacterium]
SVLAQRAACEGRRWTRAVEDYSAPIPGEIASKLGRIIEQNEERSMRAVKGSLGHSLSRELMEN